MFREAAEEQYKQQLGAGPEVPIGSTDRHFDPEKSETLKAINAGEDDSFGKTFFEKIAQAEAPRIPIEQVMFLLLHQNCTTNFWRLKKLLNKKYIYITIFCVTKIVCKIYVFYRTAK